MNIIIDGVSCECEKGEFLREVAVRNGIDIPALCHHGGLSEQGCCRVCIVEVVERGWSKIVVSCVYPIAGECEVFTNSGKVRGQRGLILALLAKRAPDSALIAGLCEQYGAPQLPRLAAAPEGKCILCGLCARACKELGAGAISTVSRGVTKDVDTPYHDENPACIGCGSCAAVCPTQAIELAETATSRTIWHQEFTLSFCAECGELLGTAQELAYVARKAGQEADGLCEACRRQKIAAAMAATYGI